MTYEEILDERKHFGEFENKDKKERKVLRIDDVTFSQSGGAQAIVIIEWRGELRNVFLYGRDAVNVKEGDILVISDSGKVGLKEK